MPSPRVLARDASLAALRAVNHGSAHACPICRSRFARFLRRGSNIMCLGCRSFARHRLMVFYLQFETDLLNGRRLLHLAPEPAVHRVLTTAPVDYVTLDLEPGPLVDITADARDLPFGDATFDGVICSHVLEHIPEDIQAAQEFARVLKPNGLALIQVPVDHALAATFETDADTPAQRLEHYGQHDHVRVYGRDVTDRLRGAFSSVEVVDYTRRFAPEDAERMGLLERPERRGEDIYVCKP